MKKILITGGAGYIGSFMVRELQGKGFEPVILDNLSQGHKESVKDFRLEQIDLVTEKEIDQRMQLFKDHIVIAVSIYDNISLQALAELCLKS